MNLRIAIYSLIIGICGSLIAGFLQPFFNLYPQNFILLGLLGVLVTLLVYVFLSFLPYIKSYLRMYFIGRYRGLWSKVDLRNLIKEEYSKADEIKIKVTRGFGLFYLKGGVFHDCIFENKYNERKTLKILLHYPCLKSEHIKRRASTNQKSKEAYIEDLFRVIKMFKEHNTNPNCNEDIFVRFYTSNEDKEWRYYVFKQQNEDKVLLFNHYDENTTGSKSRMLKVIGGHNSLCEELNDEFDKLFDNYSVELVENLKGSNRLLNPNSCEHPACRQKIFEIHKKVFG